MIFKHRLRRLERTVAPVDVVRPLTIVEHHGGVEPDGAADDDVLVVEIIDTTPARRAALLAELENMATDADVDDETLELALDDIAERIERFVAEVTTDGTTKRVG